MSVYLFTALFYLLLLLLLISGTLLCGHVCADENAVSTAGKTVEIFQREQTISEVLKPKGGEVQKVTKFKVDNIYLTFLAATDDVLIAIAMVMNNGNTEILTRYVDKEKLLGNKDIASSKSDWTTQVAVQNEEILTSGDVIKGLLTVAKNNQIFLLLVISGTETSLHPPSSSSNFKLKFVVGTVKNGASKKYFDWDENKSITVDETEKIKKLFKEQQVTSANSFGGKTFLTHDRNIMFVLQMYISSKNNYALLHLNDSQAKIQFVSEKNWENCNLHFFPWKNKIIMLSVRCSEESKKKIMESSDMGVSWNKSEEALSRHYDFLHYKQDFATVTFDTKEILLFAESKTEFETEYGGGQPAKTNVHFWMTNGNRLQNIGKIVINAQAINSINFLFANDKLFFLHQQWENGRIKSVALTDLQEQLTAIKKTIKDWDTIDAEILKLCKGKDAIKIPCTTDGLVVFLSSTNGDKITWENKYSEVNAKVIKENGKGEATKVPNGFTFSGEGVGAQWPEDKKIRDQPYNFADPGFTLVATVTIENNENSFDNSLLGLSLGVTPNSVGLWCSKRNKWAVSKENTLTDSTLGCEHKKAYNVALILKQTKLSVYVDWEQLIGLDENAISIAPPQKITHFYFGARNNGLRMPQTAVVKSHVTVTNVFLYNRPFNDSEIGTLKENVKAAKNPKNTHKDKNSNAQKRDKNTAGSSDEQTSTPLPPDLIGDEKEEKVPSPSRTEDGGVGGGVRVFSLLLALLCVSAPLLPL